MTAGSPRPLRRGTLLRTVLLSAAALTTTACGAGVAEREAAANVRVAPDTVRGVVVLTGADPVTTVTLHRADGTTVRVQAGVGDGLRALDGLEVWVTGRLEAGGMEATAFQVRGLGDLPAADGRLELDGAAAILLTPSGERLRYPNAPLPLRELAGRRVWIAGPPGAEPWQWGVLEP